MRWLRRARLEIGFPSPVVSSRSFLTRRSAALRSIGLILERRGYEPEHHEPVHHSGCPDRVGASAPSAASAQTLTVYSSLPLSGAARGQTQAVNDGARQALQEAGGMAGGRAVKFVTLNDATRARRAAGRRSERRANAPPRGAGRLDARLHRRRSTPARARSSIPITNEAGVPMISPSNTVHRPHDERRRGRARASRTSTTRPATRTYFRIMPNDNVQAAALATAMRDRGCKRVAAVHDGEVYGKGVGTLMRRDRRAARPEGRRTRRRISRRTPRFGSIRARTASPTPASPPTAPCACSTASARKRAAVRVRRRRRVRLHRAASAPRSPGA